MGNIPTVYAPLIEDYKPRSEWRQEDGYDTLLVYLPGFNKIEVTTEEDLNIVRVHGGRYTDQGNWSGVDEEYKVPENCEMSGIHSRFDGGILTITMPRRKIIANTPPPPTTTTDEVTFRKPKQEEPLPNPKEERIKEEKKPVDMPQNTYLPPQPIIMPTFPDKQPLILKPPINPLLEDNTLTSPPQQMPTTSSDTTPSKQQPLKAASLEAKDDQQNNGEFALPANVPKKDKHDAVDQKPVVAEKTWLDAGQGMHTLLEEMSKNDGRGVFQGDKVEENYKKKVDGRNKGVIMNEDRKLLVNVGVGVLVIVALGVHLSYTAGLIGKGK